MMTETYTFDDILIYPRPVSSVMSRGMVDTSQRLYNFIKLPLPIMSASMSIFDTKNGSRNIYYQFAAAMAEAGGMHILSRATLFSERYKATKNLAASGYTVGLAVSLDEFSTYRQELESLPANSIISIDIANGAILKDITWGYDYDVPTPTLILGNFGHPRAVLRKDLTGQVAFKYGIGSGGVCSTRLATGVGSPQAWVVREASKISRKPIISDGGMKSSADFVKAIALGADFVMSGTYFASAKEAPWKEVKIGDKWYKPCRGMASAEEKGNSRYIEGISGYVPYEGRTLNELVSSLKDGLASAMSYSDSVDLDEFRNKAEFIKVTNATGLESGTRV